MKYINHAMDEKLHKKLVKLAEERRLPLRHLMNKLVDLGLDLVKAQKKGSKIVVVDKEGNETQLKIYL